MKAVLRPFQRILFGQGRLPMPGVALKAELLHQGPENGAQSDPYHSPEPNIPRGEKVSFDSIKQAAGYLGSEGAFSHHENTEARREDAREKDTAFRTVTAEGDGTGELSEKGESVTHPGEAHTSKVEPYRVLPRPVEEYQDVKDILNKTKTGGKEMREHIEGLFGVNEASTLAVASDGCTVGSTRDHDKHEGMEVAGIVKASVPSLKDAGAQVDVDQAISDTWLTLGGFARAKKTFQQAEEAQKMSGSMSDNDRGEVTSESWETKGVIQRQAESLTDRNYTKHVSAHPSMQVGPVPHVPSRANNSNSSVSYHSSSARYFGEKGSGDEKKASRHLLDVAGRSSRQKLVEQLDNEELERVMEVAEQAKEEGKNEKSFEEKSTMARMGETIRRAADEYNRLG